MSQLGAALAEKARRIIIFQLLTTLVVAAAFFVFAILQSTQAESVFGTLLSAGNGVRNALSASYGGLSSVVLALISIGGFKRANELALSDPHKSMMILYIGAVVRFAAVIVLLGIGLGFLKLDALPVLTGFALAQASYLMGVRDRKAVRGSNLKP